MEINIDLIKQRFQDINESMIRLEKIKGMSQEKFLNDRDIIDITCYRLLIAIEAAIQICVHISSKKLHQVPEGYAECFAILANSGIIPYELGHRLQKMARFRNMLVHRYWEIDYKKIYQIVHESLDDLRELTQIIGTLL